MKLLAAVVLALPAVLAGPMPAIQEGACALASATPEWVVSNFTYLTNIVFWTPLFGIGTTYHRTTFDITNLAVPETRSCDSVDNSLIGVPPKGPNGGMACIVNQEEIWNVANETLFFDLDLTTGEIILDQTWTCDGQKFRAQGRGQLVEPGQTLPTCAGDVDPLWGIGKQCVTTPVKVSGKLVSV